MKEKKARVEDVMHATKAGVEEGILPGGGVALLRASRALEKLTLGGDQQIGVRIIARAIEEPIRWITTNAGQEGSIVVHQVRELKDEEGFNAQTETYENLVQAGVIDPTKVVRSALRHAASISSLLLTTEATISQIRRRTTRSDRKRGRCGAINHSRSRSQADRPSACACPPRTSGDRTLYRYDCETSLLMTRWYEDSW